jgi:hypothetical protein
MIARMAPAAVEGRRVARVVRWIEPGLCVVRDEAGLPLTCLWGSDYQTVRDEAGQAVDVVALPKAWRLTSASREFFDRHRVAEAAPAEVLIAAVEGLFDEAAQLRRINREADEYYADCARGGRNPGSPNYPPPSMADEVEREAEEALARYLREWTPGGEPVLLGFIECGGLRPDGSSGPHLRKAQKPEEVFEGRPERMPSVRQRWAPEVGPGEIFLTTAGSPVPIIAEGRP